MQTNPFALPPIQLRALGPWPYTPHRAQRLDAPQLPFPSFRELDASQLSTLNSQLLFPFFREPDALVPEVIKLADHAAAMDDRWLFVATLLLLGLFAAFVMRYFVRQHENLIQDHKQARDAYQESLRGVVAEQSAANAKLIVCLNNNTKVLEECRDELRLVRKERYRNENQ